MQKCINIYQGGMRLKDYSVKFTQLSKHVPTMVADSSAMMNKFVVGIFNLVVNECRSVFVDPSHGHLSSHGSCRTN